MNRGVGADRFVLSAVKVSRDDGFAARIHLTVWMVPNFRKRIQNLTPMTSVDFHLRDGRGEVKGEQLLRKETKTCQVS